MSKPTLSVVVDNENPAVVESKARTLADTVETDYRALRSQFPIPESLSVEISFLPEDTVLAHAAELLSRRGLVAEFNAYDTAGSGRAGQAWVRSR